MLSSNISYRCLHNRMNFGPLAAEIGPVDWASFAFWQRYCMVLQQWASATLCGVEQRAPPIFGRAAITLGIGPHFKLIIVIIVLLLFAAVHITGGVISSNLCSLGPMSEVPDWVVLIPFVHIYFFTSKMHAISAFCEISPFHFLRFDWPVQTYLIDANAYDYSCIGCFL